MPARRHALAAAPAPTGAPPRVLPRAATLTRQAAAGSKARRAEATRENLIDTTIGLLHDRSYHGATVFEVAKAAGVTPGALQHHFGSKAELMLQAAAAILRASGPDGVAWPAADGPLPERCRTLVHALWQRCYEPPRFLAAWAVYFGSADEPALRSHLAQQRAALAQALVERFVQVLPELAGRTDAPTLVQTVLSVLRGLGVVRLFGPEKTEERAQLQMLALWIETHCRSVASSTPAKRTKPVTSSKPRSPRRA